MKIALVLERFDSRRGGLEVYCHDLAAWLAARGHEIHVVTFEARNPVPPGLRVVVLEAEPTPPARAARAEQFLRDLDPDVIHDHGVGWHFDVLQPHFGTRITSRRRGLSAEGTIAGWRARLSPWKARRYRDLLAVERRQHQSRDGVFIAVSGMVARDLEHQGVDLSRIHVVFNGVNVRRFHPELRDSAGVTLRRQLHIADDDVLFLFVAHNAVLKGLATVIAAARELAAQGAAFHVAVVGRAGSETFRDAVARTGVVEKCSFCDHSDSVEEYFAAADALVHPTFYDPCSLVVLEALASGIPVITSRYNGAAEILEQGRHGWIVDDPGNAEELARLMTRLLDESERLRMGRAARELAERHDAAANFAAVEAIYRSIVSGRRRHSSAASTPHDLAT